MIGILVVFLVECNRWEILANAFSFLLAVLQILFMTIEIKISIYCNTQELFLCTAFESGSLIGKALIRIYF